MLTTDQVTSTALSIIGESGCFLVEVVVAPSGRIKVIFDHPAGLTIDQCSSISKQIAGSLDEDGRFEWEIGSPGIGSTFKVREQYEKAVGRNLKVRTTDNKELEGVLLRLEEDAIVLDVKHRGKKAKETPGIVNIPMSQIKTTKEQVIINQRA